MKKITLALLAVASLVPTAASAHEAGDYIFRAGTATVRPNAGSDDVLVTVPSKSITIPSWG